MRMHSTRRLLIGAAAAPLLPRLTLAQDWAPSRPIRLIIPFPPGGAADLLSRALSEELSGPLGQSVIPENRAGAGGACTGSGLLQRALRPSNARYRAAAAASRQASSTAFSTPSAASPMNRPMATSTAPVTSTT